MVNFPSSFDSNSSLFLAVNNTRTTLTSAIDAVTLTIPVVTTSGFPSSGYITILTGSDVLQAEAIRYTSTGATQFNASQRGADGTTAYPHNSGDNVDLSIVAAHHNELKDAIIALEYYVGTSGGGENFLRVDDNGNVRVPGGLTVIGTTATARAILGNVTAQNILSSGTLDAGTTHLGATSTASLVASGTTRANHLTVTGTFSANTSILGTTSAASLTVTGTTTAGLISAVSGTYSTSLTVSGLPVDTRGTSVLVSGTTLAGKIGFLSTGDLSLHISGQNLTFSGAGVKKTGDQMSGTLDMRANRVRNAGVVEIQDAAPTDVVQGLLWFDSDATSLPASTSPFGGFRGSLVYTSSGISTSDGVAVTLPFDSISYEEGEWFTSSQPTRLTVPSGVSRVQVKGSVRFATSSTGGRSVSIGRNGSFSSTADPQSGQVALTTVAANLSANPTTVLVSTPILTVTGGVDYFEIRASQTSSGTLLIEPDDTHFSIVAIDTRGVAGVNTLNLLQGDVTINALGDLSLSTDSGAGTLTLSGTGLSASSPTVSGYSVYPVKYRVRRSERNRIASTASQNPLFSSTIPSNTLNNGDILRTRLAGYYINTVGTRTFTLSVSLGGVPLWSDTSPTNAASATPVAFIVDTEVMGAGTSQHLSGIVNFGTTTAATSGIGSISTDANFTVPIVGSGTISMSAPKVFSIDIQHSTAADTTYVELTSVSSEII